jgi:hypothetical protein
MNRLVILTLSSLALSMAAETALAEGASLTRIEPHGVYGATRTIENGVRVTRPLPPTGTMIINPGNATPLNLRIDQYGHSSGDTHHQYGRR